MTFHLLMLAVLSTKEGRLQWSQNRTLLYTIYHIYYFKIIITFYKVSFKKKYLMEECEIPWPAQKLALFDLLDSPHRPQLGHVRREGQRRRVRPPQPPAQHLRPRVSENNESSICRAIRLTWFSEVDCDGGSLNGQLDNFQSWAHKKICTDNKINQI